MRGKFSDYGELGITQLTEAVELAKVLLHKARKLCMDVEFMFERYFNQQSEDGYDAAHEKSVEFYEALAEIGRLRPDAESADSSYAVVGHVAEQVVYHGKEAYDRMSLKSNDEDKKSDEI
jgi:hypothetical protein